MFYFVLGVLGIAIGSFLGAFTWRYPSGISAIGGRSFCPKCKHILSWYENIPVFSFLFLSGKCKHCNRSISWRYPIIEVAAGLGFIGIGYLYGASLLNLVFLLSVFSFLLAIFVIDLEHKIIPDELVLALLIFTYLFIILTSRSDFYTLILAGFLSALFLLIIHILTSGRGMGLGDVKFAIFAGTFLGWPKTPVWLFTSFLTGAVVGIILILVKKAKLGKPIAFGPFLVLGLAIAYIWGGKLIKWFF